jgi:hypothetical protein
MNVRLPAGVVVLFLAQSAQADEVLRCTQHETEIVTGSPPVPAAEPGPVACGYRVSLDASGGDPELFYLGPPGCVDEHGQVVDESRKRPMEIEPSGPVFCECFGLESLDHARTRPVQAASS